MNLYTTRILSHAEYNQNFCEVINHKTGRIIGFPLRGTPFREIRATFVRAKMHSAMVYECYCKQNNLN